MAGRANPRYAIAHVSDIAELAIAAATNDKAIGQAYNVAGPEPVRLREFTEAMLNARGVKRVWVTMPYPVAWIWCYVMERRMNTEGYLDGTKARNELGWKPKISIEEGARRYVQWRRAQQEK